MRLYALLLLATARALDAPAPPPAPAPEVVVVSAGNGRYAVKVLAALLHARQMAAKEGLRARFVAYDLGGMGKCGHAPSPVWAKCGIEHRTYDRTALGLPADTRAIKCFAWKAPIIRAVAAEHQPGTTVIWLDSGVGLGHASLRKVLAEVRAKGGFLSSETAHSIPRFTHESTVAYFEQHYGLDPAIAADIKAKRAAGLNKNGPGPTARFANCNGAFSAHAARGANKAPSGAAGESLKTAQVVGAPASVLDRWAECSKVRACVCPAGSGLHNHRQDQAALTLLSIVEGHSCHNDTTFAIAHGMGRTSKSPEKVLADHGVRDFCQELT